jgi:hypothetical protein
MNKTLLNNQSYREVMDIRYKINLQDKSISKLNEDKKSLNSQSESIKKDIEEMTFQSQKARNDSISEQEQISLKIKEKEDQLNSIQSSLKNLNKSVLHAGIF